LELPGETLIVSLAANQEGYANNLIGVPIRIKHQDEEIDTIWQGQPITVQVKPVVDCRVECGAIPLFAAPAPAEFVSNIGYTRMLTLTYNAEKATITAKSSNGNNLTEAVITVTDEDTSEVRYQGAVGSGVQLLIPYGHRYRVSPGNTPNHFNPGDKVFTAGSVSRAVEIGYLALTRIEFDTTVSDPANITGAGAGAILDIHAKMRRCLVKKTAEGEVAIAFLDNANSNLYADGSASVLTGNEGDVMVYKPEFYYKIDPVANGKWAVTISEFNLDGTYIFSPASLIGAYKANNVSNKLYSQSGIAPTGSVTQPNFVTYAKARGTGYDIIDFEQHCMIALLVYAKYGTRNSQAVLGAGGANYNTTNGSTNAIGNADTVAATSGHASFAGIEGVHGCMYEWVGGVTIESGVWTVTNPDGSTRKGIATAGTSSGWITKVAAEVGPYFDLIPIAVGGSETTQFADYYEYQSGSRVFARSCDGTFTVGGVSYSVANYASSYSYAPIGSRLAFRGVIREAESVSAFKALPVL
jgi:hypothetical protein